MDGMMHKRRWVDACDVSHIPARGARRLVVPHGEIGVFKAQDGALYAIDNQCPHKKGPLTEGIVHDTAVTCPLHNWVIDLQSGRARGADEGCVRTYPVELRGDRVFIDIGE